nr:helix-turn-helix domain-containing protein [Candidatus Sigynarchaeota archaeon]
MAEKYKITLTDEQIAFLGKITTSGETKARTMKRALILLACNKGKAYAEIMDVLDVSESTITNIKKNFHELGFEVALYEKPRPGQPKKITKTMEAKLIALACEEPPAGRNAWTISLLKEQMDTKFSFEIGWGSVQRKLADNELKPWKKKCGASQI